ncbi:MAG: sugar nucleotide-binding protein [Myxococcales bacterium]|nr:sugar nucleotide-binding protein [Myxococcales bacterium]
MTHIEAARTVLILGANGRLGQAAATAFAARGWRVLAQARRPLDYPLAGAQRVTVALDDPEALAAATRGAQVIVYAVNSPYPRWAREALPMARHAMDLALRLDARLLFPGNVYNFGAGMPARLTEDTPQRPTTALGAIRCELEGELAARRGLRSAVLCAGDFFGTGGGAWFDAVITKSLARGKLVYPGPLDQPHAWAYLPDLARAFVALADYDALPAYSRWHFAGHTFTGSECLAGIASAAAELGVHPANGFTRGGLPWSVIQLAGLVAPSWRAISQLSYLWRVPHAIDGSALHALVGPLPSTPLATALRRTLATSLAANAHVRAAGAGIAPSTDMPAS